ncbi:hypothetical protein ACHAWF_001703 [Thalassiosira exigua]
MDKGGKTTSGNASRDVDGDYGTLPCPLAINWFRNNLRVHDNPVLRQTTDLAKPGTVSGMLPVFVFDTHRIYGSSIRTLLGSLKCGPWRVKFALEAVTDLRATLEQKGSGLIVGVERTDEVLGSIVASACKEAEEGEGRLKLSVVCQEEVCSEELAVDKAVRSILAKAMTKGSKVTFETIEKSCGRPLDAPGNDELRMPWDAKDIAAESKCRASLDYLSMLTNQGYSEEDIASASSVNDRLAMPDGYLGGESFGLARMKDYIWDKDLLKAYFDTCNGMVGS